MRRTYAAIKTMQQRVNFICEQMISVIFRKKSKKKTKKSGKYSQWGDTDNHVSD